MSGIAQYCRDSLLYSYSYLQGRFYGVPRSCTELYAAAMTKLAGMLTLPVPLLSFLALPYWGGSSTTLNLVFFYLTWSALLFSYHPVTVELSGTFALRLLCFQLPASALLVFDCALPKVSMGIKARGSRHLPMSCSRDRVLRIAAASTANTVLGVLVQGILEQLFVRLFHSRSILRVTATVPLPWTMMTDVFRGLAVRSLVHYLVHRFVLHSHKSLLGKWHLQWQHSVDLPFSVVAAYDHPVNFLLKEWMPAFLPACFFRWHVLTWHLFVAIISLEDLIVYSGYTVLPPIFILSGMARRNEAHFNAVSEGRRIGNFGYLGVIDWIVGSTCDEEPDVIDNVLDEAKERRLQQRIEDTVHAVLSGVQQEKGGPSEEKVQSSTDINEASPSDGQEHADRADTIASTRRRGPQRRVRKG